ATVKSINPAGPQVKVELIAEWGDLVQVEISHDRRQALHLETGAQVFLKPKEQKLFVYQI
ncbi:TOBE-like domain-containing protein, partial [Candidatus Binatus sp.]|uniref:TOBE-like domain-containing protein n=1 Tax=Candidatus Binatus sp. TaxID=2811406 RepID=UPI003CC5B722